MSLVCPEMSLLYFYLACDEDLSHLNGLLDAQYLAHIGLSDLD